MNRLFFTLLLIGGLFSTTEYAYAQSGGGAMSYHRIGSNARILGIGNAYSAGSRLGIYPQFNPALAAQATFNQVDMSAAVMSFDRNLASLSVSFLFHQMLDYISLRSIQVYRILMAEVQVDTQLEISTHTIFRLLPLSDFRSTRN